MASFKALCLAGAACLAASGAANAADLLPPPPPVEMPIYAPPIAVGSGWYLRGDAGAAVSALEQRQSSFSTYVPDTNFQYSNLETTAFVGGGVGYQFNSFFRADVTGEYHFGSKYHSIESYSGCASYTGTCFDGYSGNISSAVFLVNGYVDLGTWYGVTPYFGAGVGVADVMVKGLTDYDLTGNGGYGQAGASSSTRLAYAIMAGVSYSLTQNLKLDIGYRYLDMGNTTSSAIQCVGPYPCPEERQHYHLAEHDIRVGLRYQFADLVPYAPPPLIRKY